MRSRPNKPSTRRRTILSALLAPVLVAVPLTIAAQASVPPTAAGWTRSGATTSTAPPARCPPRANWIIDTGHALPRRPRQLGHRRDPELHRQHRQPQPRRRRQPADHAAARAAPASGRRRASRPGAADFKPPAGGVLRIEGRIQMPNVTGDAALGYWPAFWALGSPYRGNYWNWPGIGEFDIMENVNGINSRLGRAALRREPRRAVQRDQRHRRQPGLPRLDLPVGVPHLPLRVGPQRQPQPAALVRGRPAVPQRQPEPARRRRPGPT